jgi:hypothetical protein
MKPRRYAMAGVAKSKRRSVVCSVDGDLDDIQRQIFVIRGQKVMLSQHLAALYEVQPKVLIQAVKRNIERFPDDFMFLIDAEEFVNLKSQFVTSSWGGMRRALPYAFTEQGVAMLSSVLNSARAVHVNIRNHLNRRSDFIMNKSG